MGDYFLRIQKETPTRFWINNVTIEQARLAVSAGALGCTQNPSFVWKILTSDTPDAARAKELIQKYVSSEPNNDLVISHVQRDLVRDIAKEFLPVYEKSNGKFGYVSIQDSPDHEDCSSIVERALKNREAGKNVMIKIPVSEEGLEAIEILAKQGVPINATECMAVRQALDACELYERVTKGMTNPAPLGVSVITGIFNECLAKDAKKRGVDISEEELGRAGMAIAKKVYRLMHERQYHVEYISGGARSLNHFTDFVGADVAITINWKGTAEDLLNLNPPVKKVFDEPVDESAIRALCDKFDMFKKAYDETAITPNEYEEFPPVAFFRDGFRDAWTKSMELAGTYR